MNLVCTPTESYYGDNQFWCFTPGEGPLSGQDAQFNKPYSIAINKAGSMMFVADTYDNIIREIYCEGYQLMNGECMDRAKLPTASPTKYSSRPPSSGPTPAPSLSSMLPSVVPTLAPTTLPSTAPSIAPSTCSYTPTLAPSTVCD